MASTYGRRPPLEEIRAYYSRADILNELLSAMQHWHVRFVPVYSGQSWIYTESAEELRQWLMEPLDAMAVDPQRDEYPYCRINHARHTPAHSWDDSQLWGYDFVIEKDSQLWQVCFEAMLPVMDILDFYNVPYWLKYTGHHSLHLVIPAEAFPESLHGVPITECQEALYHRLMIFLNRRAKQHYNAHDRHCPPGTNMPYTVNEKTGLVNTPLLPEDLATFRPWMANIHLVPVRDFWRRPPARWGTAKALLDEVMRPFAEQRTDYPWEKSQIKVGSKASTQPLPKATQHVTTGDLQHPDIRVRRIAAWVISQRDEPTNLSHMREALTDEDKDVRWFAMEALSRRGTGDDLPAMLKLPADDMAGACFAEFCQRHGEAVIPQLVHALQHIRDPWHHMPVALALERIGEACIPALETILKETRNRKARAAAFDTLMHIRGTPDLDTVLALTRGRANVHKFARMLGWFDDPCAWQRMTEICYEDNVRAHSAVLQRLLWNDHPDAEQLFREAIESPQAKLQRWGRWGLRMLAESPWLH